MSQEQPPFGLPGPILAEIQRRLVYPGKYQILLPPLCSVRYFPGWAHPKLLSSSHHQTALARGILPNKSFATYPKVSPLWRRTSLVAYGYG